MPARHFSLLLRWYRQHGRTLPWRGTRDSYRILVSEMMLQQTQVERVKTFYAAWLQRFPDWNALARARNRDVIHAWAGLGYNRRALALRDIARAVVEQGEPSSREGWLRLKGIGPYTSAALTCFSLGERVMPIDTNIRRVLGRFYDGRPFPDPAKDDLLEVRAERDLKNMRGYQDVPQALFDLATIVCKKSPDCAVCPWRNECRSARRFLAGRVRIPKRMTKKANERRHRNKPFPDRIYRGRVLSAIRASDASLTAAAIAHAVDEAYDQRLDSRWIAAILERLESDGLIARDDQRWGLPK